ncbi:MAG: ArgE/DapE family deacylase [Nitrososphaerota archaeon]|nr:ArgE/DapE family deacylase [Nitrososphaerota archaeon]
MSLSAEESRVLREVGSLKEELVMLTQELVRIPSISGQEMNVQQYIRSKLDEMQFHVRVLAKDSNRPNLHGRLGSGKDIMLIGHVDNILAGNIEDWEFPPYSGQVSGGRIYGRGVADMKSGLAAMMIAAKAITRAGLMNGCFSIAAVVDEEVESECGMKYLAENRLLSADAAIFGEPSFPDVVVKLKGGVWLKITTFGKSVGSGWPAQGTNAVTKMSKILLELERLDLGGITDPLLGRPTIAPGTTIRGGETLHSIPDKCESTVEIYTVPGQRTSDVVSKVMQTMERLKESDNKLDYRVERIFETEPYETSPDEKIYRNLQSSIASIFGNEANPTGIPSVGDARFMRDLGIPSVIAYGPGEKGKGHVVNESVNIDSLVNVTKVYALTALRFWSS